MMNFLLEKLETLERKIERDERNGSSKKEEGGLRRARTDERVVK